MTAVVAMRNVDLVLADPPYDFENWSRLLEILLSVLAQAGLSWPKVGEKSRLWRAGRFSVQSVTGGPGWHFCNALRSEPIP
jgi:hypothetical protein